MFIDEYYLELIEGLSILIVIVIVVLVISFIEWSNEQEILGFRSKLVSERKIEVLRDSVINEKYVKDLLVGDICHIKIGSLIPSDGIVLESNDLIIDESNLTGKMDLVKKDDFENPILFSGFELAELVKN